MKKEDIDRINELARKAKTVGLTPEENEERAVLRRAYIDSAVWPSSSPQPSAICASSSTTPTSSTARATSASCASDQRNRKYNIAHCARSSSGTVMVNSGFLVLWRQTYIPASTPRLPKQAANASSSASGTRRR